MNAPPLPQRIIGRIDGPAQGPTLVLFGAVHGNEKAGVAAIERVFASLRSSPPRLRGTLIGLVGNRRAMAQGRRFLGRDLNRAWTAEALATLADRSAEVVPEDAEQRELLEVLAPELERARQPITFLDLHSTSGDGLPFALAGDVLRNRPLALSLGIPVVLGLDEVVDGAMLGHLCDLGHVGVAIEGGRQANPRTVDRLESAIWIAMAEVGIVDRRDAPELRKHRRRLRTATGAMPAVLEIAYRHLVTPEDRYEMEPGHHSFEPIERGQRVGRDRNGVVSAPVSGLMLLPRYQREGEDGFFIARPVNRSWLRASAALRWLGIDRGLRLLPGVRPVGERDDGLVLTGAAARWISADVLHLFGYRRTRQTDAGRIVIRRRPDRIGLQGPKR